MNRFSLKKLKHLPSLSEETHCFTAELLLDGKKVAVVKNNGHGGPDDVFYSSPEASEAVQDAVRETEPAPTTDREKADQIRARIRRLAEMGDAAYDYSLCQETDAILIREYSEVLDLEWMNPNLEVIVCDLVNMELNAKHLKRLMCTRCLFTQAGKVGIWQTKAVRKKSEATALARVYENKDGVTTLNLMPFDEALEKYLQETCA